MEVGRSRQASGDHGDRARDIQDLSRSDYVSRGKQTTDLRLCCGREWSPPCEFLGWDTVGMGRSRDAFGRNDIRDARGDYLSRGGQATDLCLCPWVERPSVCELLERYAV